MSTAGLEAIEEIFYSALRRDPNERESFLTAACNGDEALRTKVEWLLSCYPNVGDFLQTPVAALATTVLEHDQTKALIGRKIGHYELLEKIGAGGMGEVYLAKDFVAGRMAALKLLPTRFTADPIRLQRFEQEARAVVALNHPNIVTVYETGTEGATHYIASELIEGETLRHRLKRGVVPVDEAIEIAFQVARALAAAHDAGIIHRDIKPENIMLRPDGYVKVLDFGIAKLSEQELAFGGGAAMPEAVPQTHFGSTVGTASYMSPEQARGERVDKATDIWSLGLVLSEMLGLDGQIPTRVSIPVELRQLVSRMLAGEPNERYANGTDLVEDIKRVRQRIEQRRPVHRRRWALIASGAVAAALCFALLNYDRGNTPRPASPAKSIAVLPFENLSDKKEDAYFAAGVQDEILTDLARIADLKVVSRTSTSSYLPGQPRNSRQIGQELGVAYLLEGNVQRADERVRINAQLIDTRDDSHRWARTYDRDVSDIFAIQTDIAQTIAKELESNISEREKAAIARPATTDLIAQDLYAGAMSLDSQSLDDNLVTEEIRLLEQAIARDPRFVRAYCVLARLHLELYLQGDGYIPARLEKARNAIEKAAEVQPEAGEVHLARAHYLSRGLRQYDVARAELELARRMLPNEAALYGEAALMDRRQGRWSEALGNYRRAIELDPRNARYLDDMGDTEVLLRHYADAKEYYQRLLRISPRDERVRIALAEIPMRERADVGPLRAQLKALLLEDPAVETKFADSIWLCAILKRDLVAAEQTLPFFASIGRGYAGAICPREWNVGYTARLFHQPEKARVALNKASAILEKHLSEQPDDGVSWSLLGRIRAMLSEKEAAIQAAQRACQIWPVSKEPAWGLQVAKHLAQTYALLGETNLAIQELNAHLDQPPFVDYGELRLRPEWDSLRGDPRFEKIVASLAPRN